MSRMSELENLFGVYVDLDSLFDTRLGCLYEANEALVPLALNRGYLTREEDNFKPLSKKSFNDLYAVRDKDTLKVSPITNCPSLLLELVMNGLKLSIDSPDFTGCKVFVNIYPYKLSEEEISDILALIVTITSSKAIVEIIDLSPGDLTVKFADKNLDVMVMYDYNTWIDENVKNEGFKKQSLTDLMLIGPKIYFHKTPTSEDIKKLNLNGLTPFKAIKVMASPLIKLELMDIDVFSVNIDSYRDKNNE